MMGTEYHAYKSMCILYWKEDMA